MNETVNQETVETTANETTETGAKTFTQAEVDTIVSERLKRERSKFADYEDLKAKAAKFDEAEEAGKSELQKATERADALQAQLNQLTKAKEISDIREKVAAETKVPASLLTGEDEDTCRAQAKAMLAWKAPNAYPEVTDSGEVTNVGSGKTRDQFAQWFERATR